MTPEQRRAIYAAMWMIGQVEVAAVMVDAATRAGRVSTLVLTCYGSQKARARLHRMLDRRSNVRRRKRRRELARRARLPARLVLTKESADRVRSLISNPPEPPEALVDLIST